MNRLAKNVGKRFEENWKASIPSDVFYYRLKDQAQSFGGCSNLRFSSKNPCDCFLFSSPYMYALELKSVGTASSVKRTCRTWRLSVLLHFYDEFQEERNDAAS